MAKPTDVRVHATSLHLLPVTTRLPLKFGAEVVTAVTCARVRLRVADATGRTSEGWGETPLSVQWVWPSAISLQLRQEALIEFTRRLCKEWAGFAESGHPMEVAHAFISHRLPELLSQFNAERAPVEPMPWLAALVCCSPFDLALHDAFGVLHGVPTYATYGPEFMGRDLSTYVTPAENSSANFHGLYPRDFLNPKPRTKLRAWHLVGGRDAVEPSELDGSEPKDGYPVLLDDWIRRDGLTCLKVKLRGNDAPWDYERMVKVGQMGVRLGVEWLSADFNCTVTDPQYVNEILDRLLHEQPRVYGMLLYVEQPFPYELEHHRIDVRSVAARKPLFMDESAHDWQMIRLGRELGWTGVALKTCKTQTGALLSLCWARAHGMTLMVQDLTNPMLAQAPHALLAAHAGTIKGVETNAMQFYPEASNPEAAVHPGLYQRRGGEIDLASLEGPGFGYRLAEISRQLPAPICEFQS